MNIPENIKNIIDGRKYTTDNIGMSASNVLCFDDMVLKTGVEQQEITMMKWLENKLPVPKVLAYEQTEDTSLLLMSKIKGSMLCDDRYIQNSKLLIRLLAESLNMLWEIDISDCPIDFGIDKKLKAAEYRVAHNLCDTKDAEPETYGKNGFKNPEELLKWLIKNKPDEVPCMTHGDFCLPNIFAHNDKISGFIDLGRCGISDKYQDIALCFRSLKHNAEGRFGGNGNSSLEAESLFSELGIKPNMELINYYILLDELF